MVQSLKPCSAYIVFTDIVEADIVRFSIDASYSVITCHLLNSSVKTNNTVCSISYGYPQGNCDMYNDSSIPTTDQPGVNLTIFLSQAVSNSEFCYVISLTYGITKIKIVGNFTECNPSILNSYDATTKKDNKLCNCYGVWSQSTQVCEEQLQGEIIRQQFLNVCLMT